MTERNRSSGEGAAPRIIFLNRYFHPDHSATSQMLSDLAFAFAARGHDVSVITSRQRYDAPSVMLPVRERIDGVEINRVWTSSFGRNSLSGRAVDYATFYLSSAWALWWLARRGDVIVAKTDPPMLSVLAAPIACGRGARLVNWLQDLFPEVAAVLGVGGGPARAAYRPLRWMRDRSLRGAAMNVVVGERMAGELIRLGIDRDRISSVPNWADGSLVRPVKATANPLRAEWRLEDKFVVGYAGNFGRAHEIETLLQAISTIEDETQPKEMELAQLGPTTCRPPPTQKDVNWLFVGGGALLERLRSEVARRKLNCIHFRSYQPRERLAETLSAADVHIVSLRPELEGLVVPSKFYGIAAAGRPTIFIGEKNGEIGRLLRKHECGLTVAQGDGAGLARAILELAGDPAFLRRMGERAREAFDAEFDKSIAVARWEKLLQDICTHRIGSA